MFASLHTASLATRQVQTAGGLSRLARSLTTLLSSYRHRRTLARLDARMLRDIGLSQDDAGIASLRPAPSLPAASPARWGF